MVNSIKKIRPGTDFISKIKFELYSMLRENSRVQDIMAKIGTEYVLKKMQVSYEQLLGSTKYIEENGKDLGDNFVIIGRK